MRGVAVTKNVMKYKKIILFTLVGGLGVYLLYIGFERYIKPYINPGFIRHLIVSSGKFGFIVFIILQVIQVVIFVIPGEILEGAGGYIFGAALGTVLSIFGITLGSIFTFSIARFLGNKFLVRILPQKQYMKIKSLIDRPKNKLIIFVLYLIPGIPKDILGYVSGITSIRLGEFVLFSTVARMPGIMAASYVGSNLYNKNYINAIIVSILMVVLVMIGTLKRERILRRFK